MIKDKTHPSSFRQLVIHHEGSLSVSLGVKKMQAVLPGKGNLVGKLGSDPIGTNK